VCLQSAEHDEASRKPAYNVQQLEECDLMPDDASAILLFDGDTHRVLQQVILLVLLCYPLVPFHTVGWVAGRACGM